MRDKIPAIILDAEFIGSLSVIQALGKHSIPIIAVSHEKDAIGYTSKYPIKRLVSPLASAEHEFIDFMHTRIDKGVIISGKDYTAEVISRNRKVLSENGFLHCVADAKTQICLYDKYLLYQAARTVGLNYPQSVLIEKEDDLESLRQIISFPLIIKPTKADSGLFYLARDEDADLLSMYRQLKAALDESSFNHKNSNIIAQAYCGSFSDQLWNYNALYKNGYALNEFTGRRLRSPIKPDGSYSSTLLYGKSEENHTLKKLNQRLFKFMKYDGIVETEWAYDPDSKDYTLFDVNTRISGNIRWAVKSGVNLPYSYYRLCCEKNTKPSCQNNAVTYHKIFWISSDIMSAFRSKINLKPLRSGIMNQKLKKLLRHRSTVMKGPNLAIWSDNQSRISIRDIIISNLKALFTPGKSAIDVLDFKDIFPTITIIKRLVILFAHKLLDVKR